MSIETRADGVWVAHVGSGPNLTDELAELKEQMSSQDTCPNVVIDMTEIKAIDSSNLSQLLRLRKQVADADGQLYIVAVRDAIWNVIITTGLDRLFNFAPDVNAAVSEMENKG